MKIISLNLILAFCFCINAIHGQEEFMTTRVIDALKANYCALAAEMLSGARADLRSNEGFTALHMASRNGHFKIAELLLKKGLEANVLTNNGTSALYMDSQNGHTEVVKLLLEKGANASLRNEDGKSAADVAANEEIRILLNNSGEKL